MKLLSVKAASNAYGINAEQFYIDSLFDHKHFIKTAFRELKASRKVPRVEWVLR